MTELLSRRGVTCTLAVVAMLMSGAGVRGQSLQCSNGSVREGDAKVWLLRACGQPAVADAYCARVPTPPQTTVLPNSFGGPQAQPVPQVACVMTDEWLYERGDGNLPAFVRIREGKITSVRFGEQGRSLPR